MAKKLARTAKRTISNFSLLIFNSIRREGGIRTPDTVAGITVFETVAFDHSATSLEGPNTVVWDGKISYDSETNKAWREIFLSAGPTLLTIKP